MILNVDVALKLSNFKSWKRFICLKSILKICIYQKQIGELVFWLILINISYISNISTLNKINRIRFYIQFGLSIYGTPPCDFKVWNIRFTAAPFNHIQADVWFTQNSLLFLYCDNITFDTLLESPWALLK